jgi:hypothetical protein
MNWYGSMDRKFSTFDTSLGSRVSIITDLTYFFLPSTTHIFERYNPLLLQAAWQWNVHFDSTEPPEIQVQISQLDVWYCGFYRVSHPLLRISTHTWSLLVGRKRSERGDQRKSDGRNKNAKT